jgi:hypothetical protein
VYQKMLLVAFVFALSSQICTAQTPPLPSAGLVVPVPGDPLMDRDWQIAVLAFRLSSIRPGTPLTEAVQEVTALGGTLDGGIHSVPPTRFYLDPGLAVEIPAKDGHVAGSLCLTLVGQRMAVGGSD